MIIMKLLPHSPVNKECIDYIDKHMTSEQLSDMHNKMHDLKHLCKFDSLVQELLWEYSFKLGYYCAHIQKE